MRNRGKDIIVIGVGILAAIYLVNPTAGFLELIPDNFPIIGNIDEAGATMILLSVARYFGMDIANLFRRESAQDNTVTGRKA
jgi:hypothetical protein